MNKYINLHTHFATADASVIEIVNQYPNQRIDATKYFSVGIHPWYIPKENMEYHLELLESKILENNCLAIGECGLDKNINHPLEIQIWVLEKQLLLAKKHDLAVILHCVKGFQEIIVLKKQSQIIQPMIIHGFSKKWELAKQLIDNGFYLSFGSSLVHKTALRKVLEAVPTERIFLETDHETTSIKEIYKIAATIKKMEVEQLQSLIWDNYKSVFGKP